MPEIPFPLEPCPELGRSPGSKHTHEPKSPATPGFSFSETPPTSPSIETTSADHHQQAPKWSGLRKAAANLLKRGHSRRTSVSHKTGTNAQSSGRGIDSDSLSSSSSSLESKVQQRRQDYDSFFKSMAHDDQDDEKCPVCLEPLRFRLAGEKPHIVPVCGHRLHHDCFEAVYGGVTAAKNRRGAPLGLCGVCRRDMKIGDDDGPVKKNKFAALSGLPTPSDDNFKIRSVSRGTLAPHDSSNALHDPSEDDDVVHFYSHPTGLPASPDTARGSVETWHAGNTTRRPTEAGSSMIPPGVLVKPILSVSAEKDTMTRPSRPDQKEHLTCLLSIEIPHLWPTPSYMDSNVPSTADAVSKRLSSSTGFTGSSRGSNETRTRRRSLSFPPSDLPYAPKEIDLKRKSLQEAAEDLRARMTHWKGHAIDELGSLRMHDFLNVRKGTNVREFRVFLFDEAILYVSDDRRRVHANINESPVSASERCRLKGRVYVRHIQSITDTSTKGSRSLTIAMSDETLDGFVMTFTSEPKLQAWKKAIEDLVLGRFDEHDSKHDSEGARMATQSHYQHIHDDSKSQHSNMSGSSSLAHSHPAKFSSFTKRTEATIPEDDTFDVNAMIDSLSLQGPPTPLPGSLCREGQRDFSSLDLMLVLSIPPIGTSSLKVEIIKSTLDFIVHTVGPRARVSLIAYTSGEGTRGLLRKTPLIALGRPGGRQRLENAISSLGEENGGSNETMAMLDHKEDRVNVVTAVNLALDVVLQRNSKSSLTGMVLVNDGRDNAQKAQMDLVMARAEAAAVPIHTIGWGKTHDPSSLWLLSNHTGGTYTFAKDFYDLRDCMAGVVGGLLSIAANQVKLHISVPERRLFKIRKVAGTPGAIVSSDGKNVDIELGELRFGERKDLLVEVEMAYDSTLSRSGSGEQGIEEQTATDAFFMSTTGLDPSSLGQVNGASLYDDEYDSMPEEVALFEVTAAYRDPAAGRSVSRLNNTPTLLTMTVNPPNHRSEESMIKSHASADIVRRRIELLVADMLTKALVLMSRRNESQAQRILLETKRIVSTVMSTLPSSSAFDGGMRRRHVHTEEQSGKVAQAVLSACLHDIQFVLEGFEQREVFDLVHRNYAAQQAVVLREQIGWTARSATERCFLVADNSVYFHEASQGWISTRPSR